MYTRRKLMALSSKFMADCHLYYGSEVCRMLMNKLIWNTVARRCRADTDTWKMHGVPCVPPTSLIGIPLPFELANKQNINYISNLGGSERAGNRWAALMRHTALKAGNGHSECRIQQSTQENFQLTALMEAEGFSPKNMFINIVIHVENQTSQCGFTSNECHCLTGNPLLLAYCIINTSGLSVCVSGKPIYV